MSTIPKAIPPEWIKQRIAFLEMKFPNMKGYTAYIQSLNKESPRGRVLISTGLMEAQLKRILLAFMRDDCKAEELLEGTAGLSSFSSRIAACEALGLISNVECADLSMIRKIRNDFAHDIETSFETPSVVSRCKELKLIVNHGAGPEIRFADSAFMLVTRFLKRPEEVALESRRHRNWIDTDVAVS